MRICISTIQRPNKSPYLDRLLTSLRQDYDGLVHLIVGGSDRSYVEKYMTKDYHITFIEDEEKRFSTNIQRAGFAYYTALTLDRNESVLFFEDDALLKPGWYTDLKERITFIPDDKYVLSLLTPTGSILPEPDIKVRSIQRYQYKAYLDYKTKPSLPITSIVTYSNTTGTYYSSGLLKTRFPEFIYKFGVEGDQVYDIVMGNFMFRYDLPIYITVPNILLDTDIMDTNLGHIKPPATVDYSDWDYTIC